MVIYEKTSRFAFHLIHEVKSRVRLPENAYQNGGNLQNQAMQRTYDALENFLHIAASYKARKILCVATSALRDAPNKNEFLSQVKNGLGLNIKVIDGQKEAHYGAIACCNLLPKSDALTIDIGGGSTEFSYIIDGKVTNTLSLELGTVRLKELYFDKGDIEGARDYINKELDKLNENYNNKRNLLTKMNIGKKDNSLVKIDYNAEKIRLTNDINTAFEKLRNNEYDNADSNYTNYITRLAVINGAFNSADSLLSTAEKSDIYVRDNKINISKSVEKIDRKINSTGVLNMRKDSYKAIKSLIDGYNIASTTDIILAASLLKQIILDLNTLDINISTDIKRQLARSA